MNSTAWLLEPPRQDIADLYDQHKVRYVFPDRMMLDPYRDDPEKFYEAMRVWARANFDAAKDHFVLTGNLTLLVAATLAISSCFSTDSLSFLRYDHGLKRYCEAVLPGILQKEVTC